MHEYQLLPPLSEEEYAALKEDIAKRGVLVPVEYDEDGNILDGHHRVKICEELGIKNWPSIVRIGMSEEEKTEHVLALNLDRRHLTREQRRELALKLRQQGWSYPKIGEALGAGKSTIERDIKSAFPNGKPDLPSRIVGKDNKQYPATKLKPTPKPYVIVDKPKDVERVVRAVDTVEDDIPAKRVELKQLEKIAREVRKPILEEISLKEDPNIKLYNCDFRELDIEPNSIDLILTDPPYPKEYLPLWGDLAKFAKEKLKDHGYLIAYSGQYHMPEVINYLISELDYIWTFCLYHVGNTQIVNNVNVMCRWKPILIFQKGRSRFKQTIQDYIEFDRKEKAHHDWQQGLPAIQKFIEHFTNPGDIVCDPFSGSGTVALACKNTGRSFIGSEIDTESYNVARRRLFYEL